MGLVKESIPIEYNKDVPIETFDYIVIDECHRSIYNLWRQVLEYFDAKLIWLTATPSKQTIGFFNNNLVMEYNHERAVADWVNVDFNVYEIKTEIWTKWSKVEAWYFIDKRDKLTRRVRYEKLDNDFLYTEKELDKSVVVPDQIRTTIRTFKNNLFTEIFPWRKDVPKTLIFAKDDSHAEDIVKIIREEFGKWNDFCQKITYKTTWKKPEDLIQDFRNDYNPRIAVTVDMIATWTDIKPLEIVFFMRSVKSQLLFEQMKWRWVRVIDDNDFNSVTPDAKSKTHFVIIDAVWVIERDITDTKPLDKKPSVAFDKILKFVSMWSTDPEVLSTLVSRISRISTSFSDEQHQELEKIWWITLKQLNKNIIEAIDEDNIINKTLEITWKKNKEELEEKEIKETRIKLAKEALKPIYNPKFRNRLIEIKTENEQIIDNVSQDAILFSWFSEDAKLKAKWVIESFKHFIEENKEDLELIKTYYSKNYKSKINFENVKKFAKKIESISILKNPENIWRAYITLTPERVIESDSYWNTDYISLICYTAEKTDMLEPYKIIVSEKYDKWLDEERNKWIDFNNNQLEWMETMKDEIANSINISIQDFEYGRLAQKWGIWKAHEVFWDNLNNIVERMNEVLV